MIKTLDGHKQAQAHVNIYMDGIDLWSYTTKIITVNFNNNTMYCTGLYSMTTRKHIGWFLREYYPHISYQQVKKSVEQNKLIDTISGDLC